MKYSTLYLWALPFIAFCCLQSCTNDKGELPKPIIVLSAPYQSTVKPIIATYCSACHVAGGSGNGDFTTYAGLKAKVDNNSFQARVLNPGGGMPPPGSPVLTVEELEKLKIWVNNGAQNN